MTSMLTHPIVRDTQLETAIRRALKLAADALLTVADLKRLTVLEVIGKKITDLTGLEHATNLQMLLLSENRITDLTPLAGLTKLKMLELHRNHISNITPLSRLTNLQWLALHRNRIRDVAALERLRELKYLKLYNNRISDVAALKGLTHLEWLLLSENRITDIQPLAGMEDLEWLWLSGNPIQDMSPIYRLAGDQRVDVDIDIPHDEVDVDIDIPHDEKEGDIKEFIELVQEVTELTESIKASIKSLSHFLDEIDAEPDMDIMDTVGELIEKFVATFDASSPGADPISIPERQEREEIIAKYMEFFDTVKGIDPDELTHDEIQVISGLNIVYVAYQLEFSATPREFNLEYTQGTLEWILSQREKISQETLVYALSLRGSIGLRFFKDAEEIIADLDEALQIADAAGDIEDEVLVDIYRDRAFALVKMGDFAGAEASERKALELNELSQFVALSRSELGGESEDSIFDLSARIAS